jgi:hypothetical protein
VVKVSVHDLKIDAGGDIVKERVDDDPRRGIPQSRNRRYRRPLEE